MNKRIKSIIALALTIIMIMVIAPVGTVMQAFAQDGSSYETLEFGSYPQTEVIFSRNELERVEYITRSISYNSFEYYSGTGSIANGQMVPSDYMKYRDFMFDGYKYREVLIQQNRPYTTGGILNSSNTYQELNGYACNKSYYFRFEPITWRVLNSDTGLVMSDIILDSQPYNNFILTDGGLWGDTDKTYRPNNYEKSSIREWLNNDFLNTAFTESEKGRIMYTSVNNSASDAYPEYSCDTTNDRVFLLSFDEAVNPDYGFSAKDAIDNNRALKASSYSYCQGLAFDEATNCGEWFLRTATSTQASACVCMNRGKLYNTGADDYNRPVNYTSVGIVPAMRILNAKNENSFAGEKIQYGSYPQSEVKDSQTVAALNNALDEIVKAGREWSSYNYYSGTDSIADGNMVPSDYMRYIDIWYDGDKYRAVTFDNYRPNNTGKSNTGNVSTSQIQNGYTAGNVYWFRFEPVSWILLNAEGYAVCENIIDSQPYNNYLIREDNYYWNSHDKENYANDYDTSSVRVWMEFCFNIWTFTGNQSDNLLSVTLADADILATLSDINMTQKSGTDYAKCQGLYVDGQGNGRWLTGLKYLESSVAYIDFNGDLENVRGERFTAAVNFTDYGFVPVIKLKDVKNDLEAENETHEYCTYTVEATCTKSGLIEKICKYCGDIESSITTEPKGHAVSDYTYIGNGKREAICSVCNETIEKTDITSLSISSDKIKKGGYGVWTVVTSTDVASIKFTTKYTLSDGTNKSVSAIYTPASASANLTVADNGNVRTWTVNQRFTYTGTDTIVTENVTLSYKAEGSAWLVYNEAPTAVKVGANETVLASDYESYAPYTLISAQCTKSASKGERAEITITTTDDCSKVRIGYMTDAGAMKYTTYQTTTASNVFYTDKDGVRTWVISYKLTTDATDYKVNARGTAWGEEKSFTI